MLINFNKRAQVFTLVAIILIGLVFVSFEIFSIVKERDSIETRISTMDSCLFSVEKNFEREMYISGFRAIFLAEDQITKNGNYINVDHFFNEAF